MKIKYFFILIGLFILFINKTFAGIYFSEILPNTVDDKNLEYIEIYNFGDIEQDLNNFSIKDLSGKQYFFGTGNILGSKQRYKVFRNESKITLNNSDEEIYLSDNLGTIIDTFNFASSIKSEKIIINNYKNITQENQEEIIDTIIIKNVVIDEIKNNNKILEPEIIIQYGLKKNKKCIHSEKCLVNLKYEIKNNFEKCLWNFGKDNYIEGNEENCNPGYIKYGTGNFLITLKVYEKGNIENYNINKLEINNFIDEKNIDNLNIYNDISINKIMPNPEGSDNFEYIELINNSNKNINLKGCILDDLIDKGSREFIFLEDEFLNKNEKKKYYKNITNINLNNDSDEINLFCNYKLIDNLKWDFEVKPGYYLDHTRLNISSGDAIVLDIIDGDTIKIKFLDSDKIEVLRLVGIDAPETKHPDKETEKFGLETYEYVLNKLKGKKVYIELDLNTLRDKYSRLLGYVYIGDKSFNENLIKYGYAKAYLKYDFEYIDEYIEAEVVAKENKSGIWSVGQEHIDDNEVIIKQESDTTTNNNNLKAIISIQGRIGNNKNINGNTITCFDNCSINFDGSNSEGNIKKYLWDFGNGEKYDGINPSYIKYDEHGYYKIYLSVISDTGEINVGEFNINFIETIAKEKTDNLLSEVYAEDFKEKKDEQKYSEIIYNNIEEEGENKSGKYSILLYVLIILFTLILIVLIFKKEKLL